MNAVMRQIFFESLKFLGTGLAFIVAMFALSRTALEPDIMGWTFLPSLAMFIAAFCKPFHWLNKNWLRVIPLTGRQRVALIVFEFAIFLTHAGLCAVAVGLLTGKLALSSILTLSHPNFWIQFSKRISILQYVMIFCGICAASPVAIANANGNAAATKRSGTDLQKSLLSGISCSFAILAGFYFFAEITLALCFLVGLVAIANTALVNLFGRRQKARLRHAYVTLVTLAFVSALTVYMEFLPTEHEKPQRRIAFWGSLAPRPSRDWTMNALISENPDDFDAIRKSSKLTIANLEQNLRLSGQDYANWSTTAKNTSVFFAGLSMFENEFWTNENLIRFEDDVILRCGKQNVLQPTTSQTHWDCPHYLAGNDQTLIRIAREEQLSELLTQDRHFFYGL